MGNAGSSKTAQHCHLSHQPSTNGGQQHDPQASRRKRSIELPDLDQSLGFTQRLGRPFLESIFFPLMSLSLTMAAADEREITHLEHAVMEESRSESDYYPKPEAFLRLNGPPDATCPGFNILGAATASPPHEPSADRQTDDHDIWTTKIPHDVFHFTSEEDDDNSEISSSVESVASSGPLTPPHAPPQLPAQLRKAVLNEGSLVPEGSGDDNSILPRPEHSVIDHLLASPINKGYFSVAVTKRYKHKVGTDRLNVI
jgi:hypothetical protein